MDLQRDRIIPVFIEEEMKDLYIDYSMSVIVARALPDVRDGMRSVRWCMLHS
jgi:DNA gyrase subunit A